MLLVRTLIAALAALFTTGTQCSDLDQEALRHGYERLPPSSTGVGASAAGAAAAVYVKVLEPRKKLSMLDLGARRENPNDKYSIVSFEIDCSKKAMRYRAAQLLELPWIPKGPNAPTKSAWHTPAKDSGPDRALAFACKA